MKKTGLKAKPSGKQEAELKARRKKKSAIARWMLEYGVPAETVA